MTPSPDPLEIRREVRLGASPERVWEALTDPRLLTAWFPDAVEMDRTEPGGRGWIRWDEHGRFAIEIVAMDPPRRLLWRWAQDADRELEATHTTTVEWDLYPMAGSGTLLRMRESGFSSEIHRRQNEEGWTHELGELVALLG